MCGIAGAFNFRGQPVQREALGRMLKALLHRGPDGQGTYIHESIGMVHARLAVLDAVGGSQPMQSIGGDVALTYNGQLFNYVEMRQSLLEDGFIFSSRSDTEVLLNAYIRDGDTCLKDFNGEWAFALWDARNRRLLLARDPFGVKPLYYTLTNDTCVFASEIKAILAYPGIRTSVDPQSLVETFAYWAPHAPRTAFAGIREIEPGSVLTVDARSRRQRRYWRLDFSRIDNTLDAEQVDNEVSSVLDKSVQLRMRADVGVGAYISGGLDSALIATLAARYSSTRLQTYSIAFAESGYDESVSQRKIANRLGSDHHELICGQRDIWTALPSVIHHVEKPLLRLASVPMFLLSRLVAETRHKVVLSGEGADELFAGYDLFKELKIAQFVAARPQSRLRKQLYRRIYSYLPALSNQPPEMLAAFFESNQRSSPALFRSHYSRWSALASHLRLLAPAVRTAVPGLGSLLDARAGHMPAGYPQWSPLAKAQYLESTGLLHDSLLSSQCDRPAMAHGVEVRLPFLDPCLVALATKLPDRLKMPGLRDKAVLRRIAARVGLADLAKEKKLPYRAPDITSSLYAPDMDNDYCRYLLSADRLAEDGLFDVNAVRRLVAKVRLGLNVSFRDELAINGIMTTQILVDRFLRQGIA